MKKVTMLGAGMAGFGASYRLRQEGVEVPVFDKNKYHGGHAASFKFEDGWIFDDGPHISFTKVERMQELFAESVEQKYEVIDTYVDNYWKGSWVKHPAICSLYNLPDEMKIDIIREFVEATHAEEPEIANYKEWLYAAYGPTFSENFPMVYGKKYHTTDAANMTTEWLGPRLYRPKLEEVLKGAIVKETPNAHYISHFRYPTEGGFVSYFNQFLNSTNLQLDHRLTSLDYKKKELAFANGHVASYDGLISSIPLPALIPLIKDAPEDVREAASLLACTQAVIVNLGVDRDDVSKAHWSYVYDEDMSITRISFPHKLSPKTVPEGKGSIQAEVYFSEKYRPMTCSPEDLIPVVVKELKQMGILREDEEILFSRAWLASHAQVIFDLDRPGALETVHGFLDDIGVAYCGRFGEWGYLWTDESFMSGEAAAEKVLSRL